MLYYAPKHHNNQGKTSLVWSGKRHKNHQGKFNLVCKILVKVIFKNTLQRWHEHLNILFLFPHMTGLTFYIKKSLFQEFPSAIIYQFSGPQKCIVNGRFGSIRKWTRKWCAYWSPWCNSFIQVMHMLNVWHLLWMGKVPQWAGSPKVQQEKKCYGVTCGSRLIIIQILFPSTHIPFFS